MNEYYYEFAPVNDYCYPDSFVLRNKLDLREPEALENAERRLSSARIAEIMDFPVKGKFDLKHLCAIHRYIFQDIYAWAGELRTVNIAKGSQFCLCQHLEANAATVFGKLKAEKYLKATAPEQIPERLAYYLGEINVLHPFREGNGRAQRVFIEYLAQAAHHHVDFSEVTGQEMIEASVLAFALEDDRMNALFRRITSPVSER